MTLIEYAQLYIKLGWGVVPLSPVEKIPLLKYWPEHPYTDSDAISNYYSQHPTHNIGIVAGFSGLCCIDCDGPAGIAAFKNLAGDRDIGAPLRALTPGDGAHLVYRHPGNCKIKSRARLHNVPIDVKADGGQFAVSPSLGRSGKRYLWGTDPAIHKPGDIPAWLLEWLLADNTPEEKEARQKQVGRLARKAKKKYQERTLPLTGVDRLREFLSRLDNVKEIEPGSWRACCPAHVSVGRQSLCVDVGHTHPVVIKCWGGCEPEEVCAAVGLSIADLMAERIEISDLGVDLSAILESEPEPTPIHETNGHAGAQVPPITPTGSFPMECVYGLPGIIGEIVRYDLETAMYPQPILALLGSLALMSVITGRKVSCQGDLRTNIYAVGLAPSGSGKNHSRSVLKKILGASGGVRLLGNDRIGSHAGIIARLEETPACVMPLDEIGDLFASLKEGGSRSGQTKSIEPLLKQLYSSSNDRNFLGDCYADLSRTRHLNQPHLVLYGSCPPANYWQNLTGSNIENGLIARFIVMESTGHVLPVQNFSTAGPPESLVNAVKNWIEYQPPASAPPSGNLIGINPDPVVLTVSPGAKSLLWDHTLEIAKRREHEEAKTAAVWSRCAEKTIKLSMLMACSRVFDPSAEEIVLTELDVAWAKKISLWSTRKMVANVNEHVSESAEDARKKKLMSIIASSGEKGISTEQLTYRTRFMSRQERKNTLADLLECCSIITINVKTKGRKKVLYRCGFRW